MFLLFFLDFVYMWANDIHLYAHFISGKRDQQNYEQNNNLKQTIKLQHNQFAEHLGLST